MSESNSLIPITDEQAKAIQEAIKTLQSVGEFLREALGTAPEDVVALLGGNWLKVRRAENLIRTLAKAKARLKRDGIKVEAASLSLGLPILIAAADESRDELQDLWAKLLAAAADPDRAKSFRIAFIETVKKMDPLDAAVLQSAQAIGGNIRGETRNAFVAQLHVTRDEIDISIQNLQKLELIDEVNQLTLVVFAFGREFLRTVR